MPLRDYLDRVQKALSVRSQLGPQSGVSAEQPYGSGKNTVNVFFVDATNGKDANDGRDPNAPLATVQEGVDRCVSGRGDVVVIMPGSYVENVVVSAKDYVHLIAAVSGGYGRPDIVPTTGIALAVDTSQGFVAVGVRFYSADADVVTLDSNGFLFEDCVFDGDSGQAATEALLHLEGNADSDSYTASEGVIRDCLFRGGVPGTQSPGYGLAIEPGDAPANGVGSTYLVVEDCRFMNVDSADIITLAKAGAVYALTNSLFRRCYFLSPDKTTYIDIETNFASTNVRNMFAECFFNTDDITATNFKAAATKAAIVGCYDKVGVEDASTLD